MFTLTKRIHAPVDVVFNVASDLSHAAERIRGIKRVEVLTPGPVGIGTKWRETRKMMGHESTETLEITDFDPPHGYTVGCDSCGAYLETVFRFEPADVPTLDAGSVSPSANATVSIRAEARSLFAKLLSPMSKRMFNKMMRGCIEQDLEDLARAAEALATEVDCGEKLHHATSIAASEGNSNE